MAVPTQGTKYTLHCNCWLAKDRGDGVTSRVFDLLDAMVVNIGVKVCECALQMGTAEEIEVRELGETSLGPWQKLQPGTLARFT